MISAIFHFIGTYVAAYLLYLPLSAVALKYSQNREIEKGDIFLAHCFGISVAIFLATA